MAIRGTVSILKGYNSDEKLIDDLPGKSLAYRAFGGADQLTHNDQAEEAQKALDLLAGWCYTFVKLPPEGVQEDQRFATE